jgi:hypothetical protein
VAGADEVEVAAGQRVLGFVLEHLQKELLGPAQFRPQAQQGITQQQAERQ